MPHEEPPRRMRTARLVGLSPDGKSLIVATESGEEFMIEADERLRAALRGIRWDSGRLEGGGWAVTADYRAGETSRHASVLYDLRGRFSVAANDEARWLLGDQPSSRGSQRSRARLTEESEGDTEPTLVGDKLALAQAAHEAARSQPADDQ